MAKKSQNMINHHKKVKNYSVFIHHIKNLQPQAVYDKERVMMERLRYFIGQICNSTSTNFILNSNMELYSLKNFTTYAMVAGPGIYAKLQPNHYVMIWVHYTVLLLPLQQKWSEV